MNKYKLSLIAILISFSAFSQDTTKVRMLVSMDGWKSPQDHSLFSGYLIGKETYSVIGYQIKDGDKISYLNHKKQVLGDFVYVWLSRPENWKK